MRTKKLSNKDILKIYDAMRESGPIISYKDMSKKETLRINQK